MVATSGYVLRCVYLASFLGQLLLVVLLVYDKHCLAARKVDESKPIASRSCPPFTGVLHGESPKVLWRLLSECKFLEFPRRCPGECSQECPGNRECPIHQRHHQSTLPYGSHLLSPSLLLFSSMHSTSLFYVRTKRSSLKIKHLGRTALGHQGPRRRDIPIPKPGCPGGKLDARRLVLLF